MKDTDFIRGQVPMTKEEIRTIALSKLDLQPNDVLMDIGAGTGSVCIEAALKLSQGRVIAIEDNEAAIELIHQNALKHGVANLEVRHTKAPLGMDGLSCVNKYFIGGSKGNLNHILTRIEQQAPADTIIVVTAIVLDTMIQAYAFFKEANYAFELIQVSVNKIDTESKVAMLMAQNPIFIITAKKK